MYGLILAAAMLGQTQFPAYDPGTVIYYPPPRVQWQATQVPQPPRVYQPQAVVPVCPWCGRVHAPVAAVPPGSHGYNVRVRCGPFGIFGYSRSAVWW